MLFDSTDTMAYDFGRLVLAVILVALLLGRIIVLLRSRNNLSRTSAEWYHSYPLQSIIANQTDGLQSIGGSPQAAIPRQELLDSLRACVADLQHRARQGGVAWEDVVGTIPPYCE